MSKIFNEIPLYVPVYRGILDSVFHYPRMAPQRRSKRIGRVSAHVVVYCKVLLTMTATMIYRPTVR